MPESLVLTGVGIGLPPVCRDQSRYAPSQWKTLLQCNNVFHWQGAYLVWSLCMATYHHHYWGHVWWHHQMETFSTLLALCAGNSLVISEFPPQRPVTRSFGIFVDLRFNKWLSKQLRCRWFEMPLCSLWHHCNVAGLKSVCIMVVFFGEWEQQWRAKFFIYLILAVLKNYLWNHQNIFSFP